MVDQFGLPNSFQSTAHVAACQKCNPAYDHSPHRKGVGLGHFVVLPIEASAWSGVVRGARLKADLYIRAEPTRTPETCCSRECCRYFGACSMAQWGILHKVIQDKRLSVRNPCLVSHHKSRLGTWARVAADDWSAIRSASEEEGCGLEIMAAMGTATRTITHWPNKPALSALS